MSAMTEPAENNFSRAAERTVLRWVAWYTRDLNSDIRDDRLSELRSDLWDHASAARNRRRPDFATGVGMMLRALRGFPDDLAWRRDELAHGQSRPGVAHRWARSGTVATSYVVVAGVVVFALVAWARILVGLGRGDHLPSDTTITSLFVGTIAVVCGLALLRRSRQRWIAALWLGLATVLLIHFGFVALSTLSATFYGIVNHVFLSGSRAVVDPLVWLALCATGVFFVALALAWAPLPTRTAKEPS